MSLNECCGYRGTQLQEVQWKQRLGSSSISAATPSLTTCRPASLLTQPPPTSPFLAWVYKAFHLKFLSLVSKSQISDWSALVQEPFQNPISHCWGIDGGWGLFTCQAESPSPGSLQMGKMLGIFNSDTEQASTDTSLTLAERTGVTSTRVPLTNAFRVLASDINEWRGQDGKDGKLGSLCYIQRGVATITNYCQGGMWTRSCQIFWWFKRIQEMWQFGNCSVKYPTFN